MAQRNLRAAADGGRAPPGRGRGARRHRRRGGRAGATRADADAPSRTTRSSACTRSPTGFTRHAVWDFDAHAGRTTTRCCCTTPYFDLYRKQVVKQADLVLAMQLRGDAFTAEQKAAQLRLLRAR